ncbi:hypothetical protein [Paenibacillus pinistramenti]|uniref:hypothetical protein n=1 Tax=Paenibacillus pinistramenti TaxID=1768003 RepID=UPI0013967D3A|nr:hypothetical protein [Paenibacillus pinistramenti]
MNILQTGHGSSIEEEEGGFLTIFADTVSGCLFKAAQGDQSLGKNLLVNYTMRPAGARIPRFVLLQ